MHTLKIRLVLLSILNQLNLNNFAKPQYGRSWERGLSFTGHYIAGSIPALWLCFLEYKEMGADIHVFLQYRGKTDNLLKWNSFSADEILFERDYAMFSILAEVRGTTPLSLKSRGKLPLNDLSHWIVDKRTLLINEEIEDYGVTGDCTLETATEWKKKYNCRIHHLDSKIKNWRVDNPDYHSDTWLSFEEYGQALQFYTDYTGKSPEIGYLATYAAMKVYHEGGYEPRLVIWFDN